MQNHCNCSPVEAETEKVPDKGINKSTNENEHFEADVVLPDGGIWVVIILLCFSMIDIALI